MSQGHSWEASPDPGFTSHTSTPSYTICATITTGSTAGAKETWMTWWLRGPDLATATGHWSTQARDQNFNLG